MPKSLFPSASPETRAELEKRPTLKLINEFDWSSTTLGPIPDWSQGLKGAVRVMMAASTPMVMMVGHDGVLIYNDAYADFAGGKHPHIFGMPAEEAWPEIADFNRQRIWAGLRGEALILRDQALELDRHGHLETVWMDLHYSPLLDESGMPLGTLCFVHETTEQKLAEQALARSEERLSLALDGSSIVGTWDWDVLRDVVTADDRFATMYNIDPLQAGLGVPIQKFIDAIHPDDIAEVQRNIETSLRDGSPFHSEYRVTGADGQLRWVIASGRARLDAEGRAHRLPGVAVDVTEQKLTTEALASSELRFRTLADTMPQMVWSTLPDGYHDYYNARWYEFTGLPVDANGDSWSTILHPQDLPRSQEHWRHSLATGEPYKIEYRLRHHSGIYRWALGLALPVRDANGEIVRWFGTCTDIDDTKQMAQERELVSQELSHRIKNIFAVLNGIISLSARSRPEVKEFADELRQRIYALGEAHDFVRPNLHHDGPAESQGSLRALIERLLRAYRQENGERVSFSGDDTDVDDAAATPLALLFHELGTNAAKYGALSTADGHVALTGRVDGDSYVLVWKETGGPAVEHVNELAGFGSRLVSLSVEGQLRGSLRRVWEEDGLRMEIVVPVDMLRRSDRLRLGRGPVSPAPAG